MDLTALLCAARGGQPIDGLDGYSVDSASVHETDGGVCFLARNQRERLLVAAGGAAQAGFIGQAVQVAGMPALLCPLTAANAQVVLKLFPFTAPRSHGGAAFSLGLGDRLGLASPGHLQAVRGRGVFPVLAQQSMRELKLTGRTYEDVLAAAVFAVFQQDWQQGWGADGDHLKTAEEVRYALGCGFTMITLDCSEQIGKGTQGMGAAAVAAAYSALPSQVRKHYEDKYLGKPLPAGVAPLDTAALVEIVLTYDRAIAHAVEIYHDVIQTAGRPIDFELSIDETTTPTTPQAHFVVVQEMADAGVRCASLAPRFIGEFQKGIDYIGDVAAFRQDFVVHQAIAAHFGYKLSIHSGSDKFAVFPTIGELTGLHVHVKTAGTSWLEAVRVVAQEDPTLFRELLAFALEHLDEARAYYHIKAKPENVADAAGVTDAQLSDYLNHDDARQVLHITYGLMLQAKNPDGSPRFHDRIYALLHEKETQYAQVLRAHIGHHIDALQGK